MNLRLREVGDAADVIEVEVRNHDVPHVIPAEAEGFHLCDGSLLEIKDRPTEEPYRPQPGPGARAVVGAEAGVDEDEAVVGLDQQHVADQRCGRQTHRAAVEVVHLHDRPPSARWVRHRR
jgi:hypothetical protein